VSPEPGFLLWLLATEGGLSEFFRLPYGPDVEVAIHLLQNHVSLRSYQARQMIQAQAKD
jgi:hypothetical protein